MWHDKSRRRISGGKRKEKRKRRKSELGRETLPCKVSGEDRRKEIKVRGNKNRKQRLNFAGKVNVTDPETGEAEVQKIEEVIESPANPHFARRDIMTNGAIIKTSEGKAKITSRPGQDGQINAVKMK